MARTVALGMTIGAMLLAVGGFIGCDASEGPPAGTLVWRDDPSGSGVGSGLDDPSCARYGAAEKEGRLPAVIAESSGLTDSAFDSDRLWTHNDSGGAPVIFAISRSGELLSSVTLEGADPDDWEDIARGPCGPTDTARRCLYVANIGNNGLSRNTVEVFRVIEPETLQPTMTIRRLETMKVRYPTGPLDAEAMFVDDTGQVGIFSKEEGQTRLFVAPYSTVGTVDATLVAEARLSDPNSSKPERITAADYDPFRRSIAFRTYRNGYEVRLPEGGVVAAIARFPLRHIELTYEPQGEALAYVQGGLISTSEGNRAPLYRYDCIAE